MEVTNEHLNQMAVKIHGPYLNKWRYSKIEGRSEKIKEVTTTWRELTPSERRGVYGLCLQELALSSGTVLEIEDVKQQVRDLRYAYSLIENIRLAGMDQNPGGWRDVMYSAIRRLEELVK